MRLWRPPLRLVPAIVLMLLAASDARSQANVSFTMGATALGSKPTDRWDLGIDVGLILKFDVSGALRLRVQTGVDKVQRRDVVVDGVAGRESVTMVCFGPGIETMAGWRDVDLFVNVTPHGTLRTAFHSQDRPDGSVDVSDLTRFSLGVTFGVGTDVFITDNIGFEVQAQYAIFNLDHSENDPVVRGLRAFAGLQFYLGRNFSR